MSANINLDDFVHWDKTAELANAHSHNNSNSNNQGADNIDLVLSNVQEDDFSFCALEHFSTNADAAMQLQTNIDPALVNAATAATTTSQQQQPWYETSKNPCTSCLIGGYACKTIREGRHKGFCTSCVALRVDCSLGTVDSDSEAYNPHPFAGLPTSPWPTALIGDSTSNGMSIFGEPTIMESTGSLADLASLSSSAQGEDAIAAPKPVAPAKIGARFSREAVRKLKNWLSSHHRHPYPSEQEKEVLQRQTGLNKKQITDWLANARRRGKVHPPRSTSPAFTAKNYSSSIDIPRRPGTPALEAMNPLQRWAHSPPENEPASAKDIARAVTASSSALSSGLNSPFSANYTDDGSSRSLCNQSSISSAGTSQSSNGSFSSVYSHGSRNSWGSLGSAAFSSRGHRRRRRRTATAKKEYKTGLTAPVKTFQCTFCTDTFRTKHDWQRHEKSLHLSLERWVCAPDGPRAINPDTNQLSCVFCGLENPDDAHVESHNHSACQERTLEERTFYRKDHLNQHLRLVHNVKFCDWSMQPWKVATPEIRSRCGFCGIVMDTWTIRVDHLAEHFKTGYSMADWKGDWGFDNPVLDMVENSIPPYLIHHERNLPLPYIAQQAPPESPRNAYGLIKYELAYFYNNHWEQHGRPPTDDDMTLEGCRIIFASELLSLQGIATQDSWLRDITMDSEELTQKAKFGPLRGAAESRLHTLKINGKDNLFEQCPMEYQLQQFVKAKQLLGLTPMDDELQEEACRIVGRIEEACTHPSEIVANWLLRRIKSSTSWLAPFRRRRHLPRSEDMKSETVRSKDPKVIDSTIHSYSRLESELAEFLKQQRTMGKEPTDEDLQRQARIIIYEFDDGWNQTAADNIEWLHAFKFRHPAVSCSPSSSGATTTAATGTSLNQTPSTGPSSVTPAALSAVSPEYHSYNGPMPRAIPFFLNDANCYRRLATELRRWVASTMSPNNPSSHVPTDDELKHQARWILYDDDDPWNQTAADNCEWLERFKRDAGITAAPGPGLPDSKAWALEQGGSGFAPPYAYPKGHVDRFGEDARVRVRQDKEHTKPLAASGSTANRFLNTLRSPRSKPAAVFCSRELEQGLLSFVEEHASLHGSLPTDEALIAKGREVLDVDTTAAEDPVLLTKFKELVRDKMPELGSVSAQPAMENTVPLLALTDAEVDSMMQEMEFDFGADLMGLDDLGDF